MQLETLRFFADLIEKETGIIYGESNYYHLETRLLDISRAHQLSVDELRSQIRLGRRDLREVLIDQATNNETLFFRDAAHFSALEKFIVDELLPLKLPELKIWSAACSTGQEAVSLAIVLSELSEKHALPKYSVLATDISQKALRRATEGSYTDFEVRRGLPPQLKEKYFQAEANGWAVSSKILSRIEYRTNNLLQSTVTGEFHLILCRNVLIYHRLETKGRVVKELLEHLHPSGALILGVGESLLGVSERASVKTLDGVNLYFTDSYRSLKHVS